jgi:TPR repeat protein
MKHLIAILSISLCFMTNAAERPPAAADPFAPVVVRDLTALAEQGNVNAQLQLGELYQQGKRVKQDSLLAYQWFAKAAAANNAEAQMQQGWMDQYGKGVPVNLERAAELYRAAADQGNASAQFHLAQCYVNGTCAKQDYQQALEWLRLSAAGRTTGPRTPWDTCTIPATA